MKKTLKTLSKFFCISFIFVALLSCSTYGESYIDTLKEAVPDEVKEYLPDNNTNDSGQLSINSEHVISVAQGMLKKSLTKSVRISVKLIAIILTVAVSNTVAEAFSTTMPDICRFVGVLCASAISYSTLYSLFSDVNGYFIKINDFMSVLSGVMGAIYVSGGNSVGAIASASAIGVIMLIVEKICMGVLIPTMRLCFAASVASSVSSGINLTKLSSFIRKCFTTVIIFLMTVVTITLAFQTSISASADSVAVRSLRFAALKTIPIIGGGIGESLRNISSGLSLTKSICGGYGIAVIVITALLPLTSLFAAKIAFSFTDTVTHMFSLRSPSFILSEICGIIDFLIATVALTAIVFIIAVTLFMNTTAALSF